jgi:uncharacterized membrane protein (GlpM family)
MTPILMAKLLIVPSMLLLLTLAGRRYGPALAGLLSALPVFAGPVLFILALEQGNTFAAQAAQGTLLAISAVLVFSLTYAWMALRFGVALSLLASYATYAVTAYLLQFVRLPIEWCFAGVMGLLLCAQWGFPKVATQQAVSAPTGAFDLILRMVLGATLVVVVTYFASAFGSRMSGIFAMFPLMTTVLVGFSHHHSGGAFAVVLLRGMVYGYFSFAIFCMLLSVSLTNKSLVVSFLIAVPGVLVGQLAARHFLMRRQTL